jgi:hypothetical protein
MRLKPPRRLILLVSKLKESVGIVNRHGKQLMPCHPAITSPTGQTYCIWCGAKIDEMIINNKKEEERES